MQVTKRNGQNVEFDPGKILSALLQANESVAEIDRLPTETLEHITTAVASIVRRLNRPVTVEEIQNMVEEYLMASNSPNLARHYITYRYQHQLDRKANTTDERVMAILNHKSDEANEENANKDPQIVSTMRDYMAGEVSRDLTRRRLLPKHISKAHDSGIIHFHDADYFAQPIHNCDLVDLESMLNQGTVISGVMIERPHTFSTACNIATQIIAQVASSQYGGQTISLAHLAPFVEESRQKFRDEILDSYAGLDFQPSYALLEKLIEDRVQEDIERGIQILQYQVVTLMTTNGQAPFISVNMYLNEALNYTIKEDLARIIEEVLRQRYEGVKNEDGVWVTPAFPKLLYVLEEDNCKPGTPYWYLTEMAARCSAKRMVPDYISEKKMLELKVDQNGNGQCYPCMGCRSFLTPYVDENGHPKYYGRFNQGVVTINLPHVALSSGGDFDKFWKIFYERLELCYEALMCRHERLEGTTSDVAPILWQHGALARLKPGEKIDELLHNGYSTISLGYAGLYECVKYMTGESHTGGGKEFALQVMQTMNAACAEWKTRHPIDFSLYGTPLESTTYKFAKANQRDFGIIDGITSRNYITNSYHVHVSEEIDAFSKLAFEAEFQKLSPGGAISYVEIPNMMDNPDAVEALVQFIYENILYAELNTKSDYCQVCGYKGEIKIVEDDSRLVFECPQCGNRDFSKMNVARRTCGYIGCNGFNQGRMGDIADRVLHVSVSKFKEAEE